MRSGMVRVLKGSHSFTCTPRIHPLTEWTIPAFAFQQKLVLIYRPRRDGRLSWPCMAGWLHTEISVRHRELNPVTVAHLSTNRAQRRLTSLIEANALTTTPDHQPRVQPNLFTDSSLAFSSVCCFPSVHVFVCLFFCLYGPLRNIFIQTELYLRGTVWVILL